MAVRELSGDMTLTKEEVGERAACEADPRDAGHRDDAGEVGHHHAEERRPHLHAARPPAHPGRDPPAARRARPRAGGAGGAHRAAGRDGAGDGAARRAVGDAAELPGRRGVSPRGREQRPVLLRQQLPPRGPRAAVHRRDGEKRVQEHAAGQRDLLREGDREGGQEAGPRLRALAQGDREGGRFLGVSRRRRSSCWTARWSGTSTTCSSTRRRLGST